MSDRRRPAVLFVQLEPPPQMLEEFHAWYDTEHLPERERIPGFVSTVRLVCRGGWPGYAGFYDLAHAGVLDEAGYRGITGDHASAWSRRLLPRMVGYDRLLLEQVTEGAAPLPAEHNGVAMLRFLAPSREVIAGAERLASSMPAGRHRVFRTLGRDAAETVAIFDAPALELIPDWPAPDLAAAFGDASSRLRGAWRYVRYRRQGF